MKKIVDNILKNNNIDENLKQYAVSFREINYQYALIRLAMNYYTYYTIILEDEGIRLSYHHEISAINKAVHSFLSDYNDIKNQTEHIEKLREQMIVRVQDLTCFVDRFNVYEHALNRVEYRFKNQELYEDYSDEELTRELMCYILEDEDSVIVNQKISQIIGQLPIRMTKNKFYEMLSAGLSIYKEGTKGSLNDFLYMIRTSGMIEESDTMSENYPHLQETLDQFGKIHFKTISSEEFEELRYNIDNASGYMEEQMDGYLMLQEIINDLLLVLYSQTGSKQSKTLETCIDIIKNTNLLFEDKFSEKTPDQIENLFIGLEGVQEELYPKLTAYDITYQIRESHMDTIAKLGIEDVYDKIFKLPKLNADSLFVGLNDETDESPVTEQYLNEQLDELIRQFGDLFKQNEKCINRAVMSMILSELPVFFNNISELQDYIYNNLSICTDKAEKLACIEILNGLMKA